MSAANDQAPLVLLVDFDRAKSRQTLQDTVSPYLYVRAVVARSTAKIHTRFVAILLDPSGAQVVIPLTGPVELIDFQRVLTALMATADGVDYRTLELDDETMQELHADLELRRLCIQKPEGNG